MSETRYYNFIIIIVICLFLSVLTIYYTRLPSQNIELSQLNFSGQKLFREQYSVRDLQKSGLNSMNMSRPLLRTVHQVVNGREQMEGAGVRICRTIGTASLRNLDPFLMLDELRLDAADAAAGFPSHPHRGFETCTIMIEGKMEHQDSIGNKGVIESGGVQWMTAGRGIIHSEMPKQTTGNLWGFQLWINLPAKDKMIKPRYQDYQAQDIPTVNVVPGVSVRVMAGEYKGVKGPVQLRNPGLLMDVTVRNGTDEFELQIPSEFNSLAYVCDGAGQICGKQVKQRQAIVLTADSSDPLSVVTSTCTQPAPGHVRFLLMAGKPLNEPIVQHGPFVMTTNEEIKQAFLDYQTGRLQRADDDVWGGWEDQKVEVK